MEREIVAVQLAAESIKTVQNAAVLATAGMAWIIYNDHCNHVTSLLAWAALACLVVSFACSIWVYHNYIWALVLGGPVIIPFRQRLPFVAAYVSLIVGVCVAGLGVLVR